MAATTTSASESEAFIKKLSRDYNQFDFKAGAQEHWSPRTQTITYNPDRPLRQFKYGVLHELAHALLEHTSYKSDFELLRLEAEAWQLAAQIGHGYGVKIGDQHVQGCLDTYRNWLHRRSACPACGNHVLQSSDKTYTCFNCNYTWRVSNRRFSRPYRRRLPN